MNIAKTIHQQMQCANPEIIADLINEVMQRLKCYSLQEQLLTLASALLVLNDNYQLEMTNVLSSAHNLVYSGKYGNMHEVFKKLMKFRKMKWEL